MRNKWMMTMMTIASLVGTDVAILSVRYVRCCTKTA